MFTNNYPWKSYTDYQLGFRSTWSHPVNHAYEGTIYSGGTSLYEFVNLAKISSLITVIPTSYTDKAFNGGVAFGDGTVAPTVEDVKLSGTQHTWITSSNTTYELTYGADGEDLVVTVVYTINNTSGADVTISEVGFFGCTRFYPSSSSSARYIPVLLERTLLETPITIPADGVGKVTYTIRRSYAE